MWSEKGLAICVWKFFSLGFTSGEESEVDFNGC
jgi:hypothetical protein